MKRARGGPRVILVYHPEEAEAYARRVATGRGRVDLRVCASAADAAAHVADAEVIYAWQFPADLYAKAARLEWLQVMGAGVDWALVPELPKRVVVTRAPGVFGPWMREYVLGWCLWVTQKTETYRAAQRAGRWIDATLPDLLRGKTLAVVGMGDIGRAVARAARTFDMRVLGVSRSGRGALRTALAAADFVVVVVPLTPVTRGLIGTRELAVMKPTAWLLNIGRGAVVDEAALVTALEARRIGGAVLDVFPTEPLPPDHLLWRLDNVVITPHISGPSTPEEIAPVFDANLARWLKRRPLRHVVDRRRGY